MSGRTHPRVVVLVGIAAASWIGLGCASATFACEDDESCRSDGQGWCEADGACSFPDPMCPSGRRYGDLGPAELAGNCVPDGGTDSGTTTTSASGTQGEDTRGETIASLDGVASDTTTTTSDDDATTTTGIVTTEPITDSNSTTLPTTSSATTNTDTSGGVVSDDDPYGSCEKSNECPMAGVCAPSGALPLTCAAPCTGDDDCPPPTNGSVVPVCHESPNEGAWCVLPCSADGSDCPRGMTCSSWRPDTFGEVCTWF